MPVKYTTVERGNPAKPGDPKKFYAQAVSSGEVTFRSLAKEISAGSTTVSDTDVIAVLNDLSKALVRHLGEGRIVRFGDFGAFQIGISSAGAETAAKVNSASVKNAKINFRPGIDLRQMISTLTFEKSGKK